MKHTSVTIILFVSMVLAGCPVAKKSIESVRLKLNLEKQKTYTYSLNTHFDMEMLMMSQKIGTGLDMDYRYLLNLDKIDSAGNTVLRSTIGDVKMKADVMGMSMGYDSRERVDTSHQDPMSANIRRMFAGMLGKTFQVTLSPSGEIQNIAGLEDIVTGMTNNLPGDEQDKAGMKDKLNESLNQQQIRQAFGQVFNLYPDKPVKIGDHWKREVALGIKGMNSNQAITYTVSDITPDKVVLDLKGEIRSSTDKQLTDSTNKLPVMNGSEAGTISIDRTSGLATSGSIDLNIKGEITLQGKKSPVDIKGKIIIGNK